MGAWIQFSQQRTVDYIIHEFRLLCSGCFDKTLVKKNKLKYDCFYGVRLKVESIFGGSEKDKLMTLNFRSKLLGVSKKIGSVMANGVQRGNCNFLCPPP